MNVPVTGESSLQLGKFVFSGAHIASNGYYGVQPTNNRRDILILQSVDGTTSYGLFT